MSDDDDFMQDSADEEYRSSLRASLDRADR